MDKNKWSKELCHAWTKQQKHDYNVQYYQDNKDKWKIYNAQDEYAKNKAKMDQEIAEFEKEHAKAKADIEAFSSSFMATHEQNKKKMDEDIERTKREAEEQQKRMDQERARMEADIKKFKENPIKYLAQEFSRTVKQALEYVTNNRTEVRQMAKDTIKLGKELFKTIFS